MVYVVARMSSEKIPPYFDMIFKGLGSGKPDIALAFGRFVHWGYWGDGDKVDGTVQSFADAAVRMTRRMEDAAGVADGQRILDVGCGFGGTIAGLDARLKNAELVGLNIDPRQLERAREIVGQSPRNRIEFVEGDACELPFPDGSFDVVLVVESIFHFSSRKKFFQEAQRVLKPGGRLVLSDFLPSRALMPMIRFQDLILGWVSDRVTGKSDSSAGMEDYRRMARETGFVTLKEDDVTRNTLPTYPVVRHIFHEIGINVFTATTGTRVIENMCRVGLFRYYILSYQLT